MKQIEGEERGFLLFVCNVNLNNYPEWTTNGGGWSYIYGFLMKLHMKKMHGNFVMEDKRMAKELFKEKATNHKLNFHSRCVWEAR
jgi:hypothetical protein